MEFFAIQVLHTNPKCDINIVNYDWEFVFSVSMNANLNVNLNIEFNTPQLFHVFLLDNLVNFDDSFIRPGFDSTSILFIYGKT